MSKLGTASTETGDPKRPSSSTVAPDGVLARDHPGPGPAGQPVLAVPGARKVKTVPEHGIGRWLHHRGIRRVLLLVRIPVGLAVGVALVWFAQPSWFWAAAGVALVGELVQMWAAACLEKRKVFLPRGPYTLVRNPMYMGRFFVMLGVLGVLASPWVLLAFVLVFVPYVIGRVIREEKTLPEFFGEPYRAYVASVPRFLPFRLRPYRSGGPLRFFSWPMLVENNEHLNLMAVVGFFLLVYIRLALA